MNHPRLLLNKPISNEQYDKDIACYLMAQLTSTGTGDSIGPRANFVSHGNFHGFFIDDFPLFFQESVRDALEPLSLSPLEAESRDVSLEPRPPDHHPPNLSSQP